MIGQFLDEDYSSSLIDVMSTILLTKGDGPVDTGYWDFITEYFNYIRFSRDVMGIEKIKLFLESMNHNSYIKHQLDCINNRKSNGR